MKTRLILAAVFVWWVSFGIFQGWAAEKLDFGTSFKRSIEMSLAVLATEEKGFWQKNGLEVKWTPFRGGRDFYRSLAAGHLHMGLGGAAGALKSISSGVPVLIVADLRDPRYFYLWVRGAGPIKQPKDLKGGKIGIVKFGVASHGFAQIIMKGLGLEKETRFIAVGRLSAQIAALKKGTIDAFVQTRNPVAKLVLGGEIRELASAKGFLPKKWVAHVAMARKDIIKRNPGLVRKAVTAVIEGKDYVMKDRSWTRERLKSHFGFDDKVAAFVQSSLRFGPGGKVDREAFDNVLKFLVEYGFIEKKRALPLDQVFTTAFTE